MLTTCPIEGVGDVTLVDDFFEVHQNAVRQPLDIMVNDIFPPGYEGARIITSPDEYYRRQVGSFEVAADGKTLLFSPDPFYTGPARINYRIDGLRLCSGQVNLEIVSPLVDDEFQLVPDSNTYTLNVFANDAFDSKFDVAPIITHVALRDFSPSPKGDVTVASDGSSVIYRRPEGFYGDVEFHYFVGGEFGAKVFINVVDPFSNNDTLTYLDGSPAITVNVLENDPFWESYQGDRKITEITRVPKGATASVTSDGESIQFSPGSSTGGYVRYIVDNRFEASLYTRLKPLADDDWFNVNQDEESELELLSNDREDAWFSTRAFATRITDVSQPPRGQVRISEDGRSVFYTPPDGFTGRESFSYVADGKSQADVLVIVEDPDSDLSSGYLERDEFSDVQAGAGFQELDVLANDFPGRSNETYRGDRLITSVTGRESARVEVAPDGKSVLFEPLGNQQSHRFWYVVDNRYRTFADVDTRLVAPRSWIPLTGPNPKTINVVDEMLNLPPNYDGPGLISSVRTGGSSGFATISPDGKSIEYVPGLGDQAWIRYDIDDRFFNYIAAYPHQYLSEDFASTQQEQTVAVDVLANDFGNENLPPYEGAGQITSVTSRSGNVDVSFAGGQVEITPKRDVFGKELIDYVVDGVFASSITLTIEEIAARDQLSYPLGSTNGIVLDVLQNDGIFAGYSGPLEITDVILSSNAVIEIANDAKSISYKAAPGFRGVDRFRYVVDNQFSAPVDVYVDPPVDSLFPNLESIDELKEIVTNRGEGDRSTWTRDFTENVSGFFLGVNNNIIRDADLTYVAMDGLIGVLRNQEGGFEAISWLPFDGHFADYHLSGDRLVVISRERESEATEYIDQDRATNPANLVERDLIRLTVFDVSDPTVMNRVHSIELQGSYVQGFFSDGTIRFAARNRDINQRVNLQECYPPNGPDPCNSQQRTLERIENQFGAVYQDIAPQYAIFNGEGRWTESRLAVLPEDFIDPRVKKTSFEEMISSVAFDIHDDSPELHANMLIASANSRILMSKDSGAFYVFESRQGRIVISKYQFDADDLVTRKVATTEFPGSLSTHLTPFENDGLLHITVSNGDLVEYQILQENAGILDAVVRSDHFSEAALENRENGRILLRRLTDLDEPQIQVLDISDPADIQVSPPYDIPLPSRKWTREFNHTSSLHSYTADWVGRKHVAFRSSEWVTNIGARIYTVIVAEISNPGEAVTVYEEVFIGGEIDLNARIRESILSEIPELSPQDVDGLFSTGASDRPAVDGIRFEVLNSGESIGVRDLTTGELTQKLPFEIPSHLAIYPDPIEPQLFTLQEEAIVEVAKRSNVPPEEVTLFHLKRHPSRLDAKVIVDGTHESITIPIDDANLDGQIEGFVYYDANGDGTFNEELETPILGSTVTLTGNDWFGNPLPLQIGTTNFRGAYEFDVTEYGEYEIRQTQPQGYVDGIDTPDPNHSLITENDVISRRIFHGSGADILTSLHSRNNNFGEADFASSPTLPDGFSHALYFTRSSPFGSSRSAQTVFRLPVSEHGAKLQLGGDGIFYVLDGAGEIMAIRDGSGYLATEGADIAAKVDRQLEAHYRIVPSVGLGVEFEGTGRAEEYFVSFFAKPGSSSIRDLAIDLNNPATAVTPKIQIDDQRLILVGTIGDDVIDVSMSWDEHVIRVNDLTYVFDSSKVNEIHIGGAQGHDEVRVGGSGRGTHASLIDGRSTVRTDNYSLYTYSMERTTIDGDGRVEMYGSQKDDQLESSMAGISTLTTPSHEYIVSGFDRVDAYGRGGNDTAYLYGTPHRNTFAANKDHAWLKSYRTVRYAKGFERVNALGGGGDDEAYFFASDSRNRFVSTPSYVMHTDEAVTNVARGFTDVRFEGSGGNDAAYFYGPHAIRSSSPRVWALIDRSDREETVLRVREFYVDAVLSTSW